MPRGPNGEKRSAGVISNAVQVMRITTGEEPEDYGQTAESESKNVTLSDACRTDRTRYADQVNVFSDPD
jgi:hypothetical protein